MNLKEIKAICRWLPFKNMREAARNFFLEFSHHTTSLQNIEKKAQSLEQKIDQSHQVIKDLEKKLSITNNRLNKIPTTVNTPVIFTTRNEAAYSILASEGRPFISTIVPIYNLGEKYVRACVESLINQSLENIEIILVNDCSPCPEDDAVCSEYAAFDSRIKYIKHESNQGTNVARASGFQAASGHFIHFLDGDDYIDLNAYSLILNELLNYRVDVLVLSYTRFYNNIGQGNCVTINTPCNIPSLIFGDDIFKLYCTARINSHLWNKVFRKDFLSQFAKDIFDTDINLAPHEDVSSGLKMMYHAKSLKLLNFNFYFYRIRKGSAINSVSIKNINSYKKVFECVYTYFSENYFDENFIYLIEKMLKSIDFLYYMINTQEPDNKETLLQLSDDTVASLVKLYIQKLSVQEIDQVLLSTESHLSTRYRDIIRPRLNMK